MPASGCAPAWRPSAHLPARGIRLNPLGPRVRLGGAAPSIFGEPFEILTRAVAEWLWLPSHENDRIKPRQAALQGIRELAASQFILDRLEPFRRGAIGTDGHWFQLVIPRPQNPLIRLSG